MVNLDRKNQDDLDNNGEAMYGSNFLTASEKREQISHAKYGIPSDENGVIVVLRTDRYITLLILEGNPFASANDDAIY
ncbi:hypothetical protein INT44_008823 [Umbelopsis vinacea]|uniref:Uncharacterized protein n=1 Tax=Umbelopsis vinacea TaxID=44442 RepID=A0A8H7U9E7_9FUNG|nr:hypothetical protein INT44_008823 [Umbelopsis vinacea]